MGLFHRSMGAGLNILGIPGRERPRALARAAGALGFMLSAGCAAEAVDPAPETSVGAVEGTDAVVAAVRGEGKVTFYVCGGASSYATMTRWFEGPADASGAFSLANGGWTASAEPGGDAGRLRTPDGAELAFHLRPASLDRAEGLYAAVDSGCRTGVVVHTPEGAEAPALQGTWCGAGDRYAQVTPIRSLHEIDRRGIEVRVEVDGARKDLLVTPLDRP
ncbi:hypothetical protein [Sorangium sp. So ce1389]|uniref:hypothetical protein n=1 Tax=Sorangium sp. So ce1389 TaxID=3133336 RepID=UPI003F6220E1